MSRITKPRFAAAAAVVLLLFSVAAYAVLSSRTFCPELVFGKVQAALADAGGYVLSADVIEGNPLTGVIARDVRILHESVSIADASDIEMKLSFPSLLTGKPKLASMTFRGLSAACDVIQRHLPEKKEESSAGAPALEKLIIVGAKIETRWGALALDQATVSIGADRYRLSLDGRFRDKPLIAKGVYSKEENIQYLRKVSAAWAGQSVKAEGTLSPELSIACSLQKIDMDIIAEVFPSLASSTLTGVYSGEIQLRNNGHLRAVGRVNSSAGRVWRLPFEKLAMDLDYGENRIRLSNINARIFGAESNGGAEIALFAGRSPNLSVRLEIRKLDTRNLAAEFEFLGKFPAVIDFASCDITGPPRELSGPVHMRASTVRFADFEFTSAQAMLTLRQGRTLGAAFSGGIFDAALSGEGDIGLSAPYPVNLAVALTPLSLASLAKKYPQIERVEAVGVGRASAKIQGPAAELTAVGAISLPRLTLKKDYAIDDLSAEFAYGGRDGFSLKGARASWDGAEITAEGKFPSDQKLDFRGNFSKLKLETFGKQVAMIRETGISGVASGRWLLGGNAENPVLSFDVELPQLSVGQHATLARVGVEGAYEAGEVRIARADMRLGNAPLSFGGRVLLPEGRKPLSYDLKGSFKNLNPGVIKTLSVPPGFSSGVSGDLNGDIQIWASGGGKPQARVSVKSSSLATDRLDVLDLSGTAELEGNDLKISNVLACLYQGNLRLAGRVKNILPEKPPGAPASSDEIGLDLHVGVTSVDVGRIARVFSPAARGYQGLIIASADVKGTVKDPSFYANGDLLGVRAFGLLLPRVRFTGASGNLNEIHLPDVRATVGRGAVRAVGELKRAEGEDWRGVLSTKGENLDIRNMTFSLDDQMRRGITGRLDFDFEGKGSISNFEGRGTVCVPDLNVMGLKLTSVRAPFMVSDGFVMVEDSSANAYNGTVMMQVAKDLKGDRWGGRIEITSADLDAVVPDLLPDAGGAITGKTNFKLRIGGDSRRTSMQDGEGSIEVVDGEITGFKGAVAVSKVIGGRPLRFKSALGSFNFDRKALYLLPGSRVAAPKGDPIFKYVMIDGSVSFDRSIDISCVGNVNIRALNTFAGALQGLMAAAIDNSETLLHDFLGGAISGFSRNEFRDVSLRVKGPFDDLKFLNVKVTKQEKLNLRPDALSDPDHSKEKDPEKIRINLEFPVGPGSDGGRTNGDAAGQVLEQAIKGILSF